MAAFSTSGSLPSSSESGAQTSPFLLIHRPARRMRRPRTNRQPPPSSFRSPRAPSLLLPRSYPAFPVPLPPPSFLPWICTWCRQILGLPTFPRPWLLQWRPAAMSARLDPRGLEVWMGKSGRLDAEEKVSYFFVVTRKTRLAPVGTRSSTPTDGSLQSRASGPSARILSYGDQRIPAPFLHVLGSTQHGPNSTEPSAASIFGASTPIFGATAPDATASLEGGGRLLRSRLPFWKHQILCSYNKKKSAYMRWKQIGRVCCLVCCRKLAWSSVL